MKYQKEHYPDMHEVTRRMPVAESVDDSRRTTLDLMKTYPDLKAVVSFGSNGPIDVYKRQLIKPGTIRNRS